MQKNNGDTVVMSPQPPRPMQQHPPRAATGPATAAGSPPIPPQRFAHPSASLTPAPRRCRGYFIEE